MQRIDAATAANALPPTRPTGTPGYFAAEDLANGIPATQVTREWCNGIQEELVGTILAAGITLSKVDNGQLLAAVRYHGRNPVGPLVVTDTTASTSTSTGALRVAGGAGIGGSLNLAGDLVVGGNLTINGTTTTINATAVSLDDPTITLGGDTAPTSNDGFDRGVEYRWHNGTAAKVGFFGYDVSTGRMAFIPDATFSAGAYAGTVGTIEAALQGNATSATSLATARTIALTGDVTGSATFNGSANAAISATLANSGVGAGTFTKVTVDTKGRVTSGSSITSSDVTTGLGFTPASKGGDTLTGSLAVAVANASFYLQKTGTGQVARLNGYLNGLPRWIVDLGDDTAEAGSNTGSNLRVGRFDDAGTYQGEILTGSRANGLVTVWQGLSVPATTASTSTTTGALTVSGGVGIAGALYVGAATTVTTLLTSGSGNANSPAVRVGINGIGLFRTGNDLGLTTAGGEGLRIISVTNAVIRLEAVGAATGGTPILRANGTDVNINLRLDAKGAGEIVAGAAINLPADPTSALHAATKQYVDAASGGGPKVVKTGDTMTGDLTIAKISPVLYLQKAASGQVSRVAGNTGSSLRWAMDLGDDTAESGSNAGSNFRIVRCSDAGAGIDVPFFISRADGRVSLVGDPTAPLHATTKGYVDASLGGSATTLSMGADGYADFTIPATGSVFEITGTVAGLAGATTGRQLGGYMSLDGTNYVTSGYATERDLVFSANVGAAQSTADSCVNLAPLYDVPTFWARVHILLFPATGGIGANAVLYTVGHVRDASTRAISRGWCELSAARLTKFRITDTSGYGVRAGSTFTIRRVS